MSLSYEDNPYCVALSHAVNKNIIYFHSALQGFKIDLIKHNPKGYFLFISKAEVLKQQGSVCYKSCGAIGSLRYVDDNEEKQMALRLLTDIYMGREYAAEAKNMINSHADKTAVYAFEISKITGKHNN